MMIVEIRHFLRSRNSTTSFSKILNSPGSIMINVSISILESSDLPKKSHTQISKMVRMSAMRKK